jgi:enolase
MKVKKIGAKKIKDSRGEKTILVWIKTGKGKFKTISPSGKSTGMYEVNSYYKNLDGDVKIINNLDVERINGLDIHSFNDLKNMERVVKKIGGNSLFALEASFLKALSKENGKELWEFLSDEFGHRVRKIDIRSVGNAVGGGLHSKGVKGIKPDFQEFLFISETNSFKENVKINNIAYGMIGRLLKAKKRNDEGAWEIGIGDEEQILRLMKVVQRVLRKKGYKIDIGLDVAASSFFIKKYRYRNPEMILDRIAEINFLSNLIEKYELVYVEDPLNENDYKGFATLLSKIKKVNRKFLIVGDDLTTTNPKRFKKAIKEKSINGIIVKPNQIGSLIMVKEVIDLAKKKGIKTIISHRSGDSVDDTIADLAVGFGVDYIKTGIYGKVRKMKLNRLVNIERKIISGSKRS